MKNILERLEESASKFANKTIFVEQTPTTREISYFDFILECKSTASFCLDQISDGGGYIRTAQ